MYLSRPAMAATSSTHLQCKYTRNTKQRLCHEIHFPCSILIHMTLRLLDSRTHAPHLQLQSTRHSGLNRNKVAWHLYRHARSDSDGLFSSIGVCNVLAPVQTRLSTLYTMRYLGASQTPAQLGSVFPFAHSQIKERITESSRPIGRSQEYQGGALVLLVAIVRFRRIKASSDAEHGLDHLVGLTSLNCTKQAHCGSSLTATLSSTG